MPWPRYRSPGLSALLRYCDTPQGTGRPAQQNVKASAVCRSVGKLRQWRYRGEMAACGFEACSDLSSSSLQQLGSLAKTCGEGNSTHKPRTSSASPVQGYLLKSDSFSRALLVREPFGFGVLRPVPGGLSGTWCGICGSMERLRATRYTCIMSRHCIANSFGTT